MIGDGYGVLSALLKSIFPTATLFLVDIGKTLLFQAYYCQKCYPELTHKLAEPGSDLDNADFVYCPAENLENLGSINFDLAINIASMQEMNQLTIARYFEFLRSHLQPQNLFYCCNRESKTLLGGEVSEFHKYPWWPEDKHLVEEHCPWHRYYFARSNVQNGLRLLGVRVPFVNFYEGPILHRLTVLATA